MSRPSLPRAARVAAWSLPLALWIHVATGCGGSASYPRSVFASAPSRSVAEAGPVAAQTPAGSTAPPPPPAPAPGGSANRPSDAARVALASATGNRGPGANTGRTTQNPPGGSAQEPAQPAQQTPAPLLIYTAQVDMQVDADDIAATLDRVIDVAQSLGGYIASRTDASVQVRIPSARFREGLTRVEGLGDVLHRSVNAQDVSEEYHDIEVRLQNLRAVRQRLQEFLNRAQNLQDALTVERELERVAREIDTLEGRLRFLGSRVAFSLVTVNLTARARPVTAVVPEAPAPEPRVIELPVEWLSRLGLDRLLDLRN